MKRFLWFIVCLMTMVVSVNAQSSPMEKISDGNNVFHVHFGVSMSNITGSYTDGSMSCENVFGQTESVGAYIPTGIDNLYLGAAIGIGMRGYKENYDMFATSYGTTFTAYNIYLSPSIGYLVKVNDDVFIDAHLGAYYSNDFSHSFEGHGTGSFLMETNVIDAYESQYNKSDGGLIGGVGVWYKHFGLELNYSRGLTSLYKDFDAYTQKFTLSLGYAF